MRLRRFFNIFSVALAATCGASLGADPTPLPTERLTITQVLSNPKPFELYSKAYNSFEFSSTSRSSLGKDSDAKPLTAHTTLRRNEDGDIELRREPMYDSQPLFYRYVKGKAYIRKQDSGGFTRVREQKEFERWTNLAISEVLELFKKAGFDGAAQGSVEGNQLCWTRSSGNLCADAETGLPIQGSVTSSDRTLPPIQVEFKAIPRPAGGVKIDFPQ